MATLPSLNLNYQGTEVLYAEGQFSLDKMDTGVRAGWWRASTKTELGGRRPRLGFYLPQPLAVRHNDSDRHFNICELQFFHLHYENNHKCKSALWNLKYNWNVSDQLCAMIPGE